MIMICHSYYSSFSCSECKCITTSHTAIMPTISMIEIAVEIHNHFLLPYLVNLPRNDTPGIRYTCSNCSLTLTCMFRTNKLSGMFKNCSFVKRAESIISFCLPISSIWATFDWSFWLISLACFLF